jgi:MspA
MLKRFAIVASCMLLPLAAAPLALAEPAPVVDPGAPPPVPNAAPPAPDAAPPPDTGLVASAPPAIVATPDGWTLTVAATDETQLPVAPLTTATSSREYLVGGTFAGAVSGKGSTKLKGGTLEAGYQIGCGIELASVRLIGSAGIGTQGSSLTGGLIPTGVTFPLSGTIEVHARPGTVTNVSVNKKEFKKAPVRVTIKDTHIKIDGCVGQSFLRSFATLTSSTEDTDDVVAYYGVTKSV